MQSSEAQMMIYEVGKITQINYVLVKILHISHHPVDEDEDETITEWESAASFPGMRSVGWVDSVQEGEMGIRGVDLISRIV